jgi:hypothetical protein
LSQSLSSTDDLENDFGRLAAIGQVLRQSLPRYQAPMAQRPFASSDRSREIQIIVTVELQHRVRAAKPAA